MYEPREQAWVHDQPYNPGEQAADMTYHAPGHAPQQHVRGQPHHEAHYDEDMRREDEAITQNIAEKLQMQHEHEQHHGHMRQRYSVDDPRYAPVQPQDGMGPSGHSSLPTSSITPQQQAQDQNHESVIHAQAETVATDVGDESSRRLTKQHVPYDPNLTCPMCNKQFRIGEIQKYRAHVRKNCVYS